jgi:integrase
MLTDLKISKLKPRNREYSLADGYGLSIYVTPKGVKKWRYRYRFNRNASMISLGKYPAVSLSEARKQREVYQKCLFDGINPKLYKDNLKQTLKKKITFREALDQWFDVHKDEFTERTAMKQIRAFELHIFPYIGNKLVVDLKPLDMLNVFREIDSQGKSETLKKVKGWCSRIFRDCVVLGIIDNDPTRDLPSDSFKKRKSKHYATVTSPSDITDLLNTISKYKEIGTYEVHQALNLGAYLLLRPSELTDLLWEEVDFKNKIIRIGKGRMKSSNPHLVPLSSQVLAQFEEIKEYGLSEKYVFPSSINRNASINSESLRMALRRLGIPKEKFTPHGFRHMASTRLHELGYNTDVIESQLAHKIRGVRGVYNQAQYLEDRKVMMEDWSNYLSNLQKS